MTDALISHPQFGSLWLENVKIQGDHVVGEVEDDRIDGHRIMATMNFPRNCVRRWSDEHTIEEIAPERGDLHRMRGQEGGGGE